MAKEITITINTDGTVEMDQLGWKGKSCENAVDDIIKAIGKEVKSERKRDWYKQQRISQQQHRLG